MDQQHFFDVIKERRSVRSYDPEVKISREELSEILQQATLAPSGANLQPWRFLVIDSQELKQKLLPIAFNQQQVVEASAVIAVLGDMECYKLAEKIYGQAVEAGYMPAETAKSFVERYTSMFASMPTDAVRQNVVTDSGLVSMQLMLVARAKGYDTVPMGGYDKEKFKEAFGISDRYVPIMLIALGKAAKPGHPTTRLPIEDVTFFNEMPKA
jgi:nitroreductase